MSWNNGNPLPLFNSLRACNIERNRVCFPACESWSLRRWSLCIFGEAGELINAVKHLDLGAPGAEKQIADEAADVLIYLDIWLMRQNFRVLSACLATNCWYPDPKAPQATLDMRECEELPFMCANLVHASDHRAPVPLPTLWTPLIQTTTRIMQCAGLDPAAEIARKFDCVSAKKGYTQRLSELVVPE